jgi:hypothetical protein
MDQRSRFERIYLDLAASTWAQVRIETRWRLGEQI